MGLKGILGRRVVSDENGGSIRICPLKKKKKTTLEG